MAKGYGRGMPGMGGGMNMNMLKQAQKMQQDMLRMQQELQEKEYQAASGGGVVTAVVNGKHELRKGFVDSMSLDNANFDSQEAYEQKIMEVLNELKGGKGRVASFYSHVIGDGEWCISTDRLEFLLRKAKEMGLQFYTFQELQYW